MSLPTSLFVGRRRLLLVVGALVLVSVAGFAVFAGRVAALRNGHATGPGWSFPSQVYCDEVTLVRGRVLAIEYLLAHLAARDYEEVPGHAIRAGTFVRQGEVFEIALRPGPARPATGRRPAVERVRLRIHGGRLAEVEWLRRSGDPLASAPPRLEPVRIALLFDDERTWRTWVDIDQVPEAVCDAIVASEDRRFRSHIGLDLRGYLRALRANVRAGEVREGGSTITQQLARSLFLGRQRSLGRKLAEVPLALGLEIVLGKRRILEMYLNAVYWGQAGSTSIGGIEAAARWYFDVPPESLGVLEGATLAAMIPAPNVFDPFERPERVRDRRNRVLRDLVALRRLDRATAEVLAAQPLNLRRGAAPGDPFPWYSGFVLDQLAPAFDREAVTGHGLAIYTRMDLVWQRQAQNGLAEAVTVLDGGGRGRPPIEGAFVALEPGTGAVRALVGGRTSVTGAFNRATQARRQTGSAIKPIVYAAALAAGRGFTPATVVPDVPRTFPTDRGPWTPRNDDGTYHTTVTLVKALERSINVATTNLVDLVGPRQVARVAARFGLGTLKPVMSIGLGSNEATVLDLTRAFAVFGDGGLLMRPSAIRAVTDRGGRDLFGHSNDRGAPRTRNAGKAGAAASPGGAVATRAIPEPVAALMTGLLTDVVRFGVAYPLRANYGFTRPVAGKTGTTDEYKDAWFVGFTPDIVAGVWIGYDRPRSLGRLAADTALPVWAWIVGPLLKGYPPRDFASATRLEWRDIEPWSGLLASRDCRGQPVPFLPGTAPTQYCAPGMPLGPEMDTLDSTAVEDSSEAGAMH